MYDVTEEAGVPRSNGDKVPASYALEGEFPHVQLREDAPVSAHFAVAFAQALHAAMKARKIGIRPLARAAGLSHPTVIRILDGLVLPDLGSLARLEVALGTNLYPAELFGEFADQRDQDGNTDLEA